MPHLSPSERLVYVTEYESYIEQAEYAFEKSGEGCDRCPETNAYEPPDFSVGAHQHAMRVIQNKRDGVVFDPNYDPFCDEVSA